MNIKTRLAAAYKAFTATKLPTAKPEQQVITHYLMIQFDKDDVENVATVFNNKSVELKLDSLPDKVTQISFKAKETGKNFTLYNVPIGKLSKPKIEKDSKVIKDTEEATVIEE